MLIPGIISFVLSILVLYVTVKAAVNSAINDSEESPLERQYRLSKRLRSQGVIDEDELRLIEDSLRVSEVRESRQRDYNASIEVLLRLRDEKNLSSEDFSMKKSQLEAEYDMASLVPYSE